MNRRPGWSLADTVAIAVIAAFAGGALFVGLVAVRAASGELSSLKPTPAPVPRPPGDPWIAAAKDVSLVSPKGVVLRGWTFPSSNGAAVLLVDGAMADRTQLLTEARILSRAGYGVLVYDQPGTGESGGVKRRGDEQDFIGIAVDALSSAPDVRPDRIGALGFSTGAAVLAGVAARDHRIRAVVLAGCYTNTEEHVRQDFRRWGALSGLPALWAARWAGLVELHPIDSVPSIAPRALFLLAGDADTVVSPDSSERLFAVARSPKAVWIVHGAGHGQYADAAGDEYGRRLVAFFDDALAGANAKLDIPGSMP
jgi:dipeptidyl aminopeptidase/acylaminoacyl peptidase